MTPLFESPCLRVPSERVYTEINTEITDTHISFLVRFLVPLLCVRFTMLILGA